MPVRKRIDLSLILPCYNEAGLFADSVRRIKDVLDLSTLTYEIIFVDDASRDATPELIRKATAEHPDFSALFHAKNRGRGRSVTDGLRAARGTVAGFIDIDCEVSPVYIPEIAALILSRKADVVIGHRMYRTSISSIIREVLSRGYRWLSDKMIGTHGRDTESGYKFFNRKKILPVLSKPRSPGWFWDTEIMVYADRAGLSIREFPVLFIRRFDKKSSVNLLRDTYEYLVNLRRFRNVLYGTTKRMAS